MAQTSEAMRKAISKYKRDKIEEIRVSVPKGKKADLQAHATTQGESLNGFVNRAIDSQVERDIVERAEKSAKYKKRADGRYCTHVNIGVKPDGKPHRKTVYAKTIPELEEKAAELRQHK